MIQFDVEPEAAQIVLGHGAQHCRFVRTADEDLADEFPRVNRLATGEAMVARHQDDQRLVVHHLVAQVEGRLDARCRNVHNELANMQRYEEDSWLGREDSNLRMARTEKGLIL